MSETIENSKACAGSLERMVSLPKLRLLVVMWAGRGEPNSLTCAKELVRTILPALSETEAAELAEAIEKQKAG